MSPEASPATAEHFLYILFALLSFLVYLSLKTWSYQLDWHLLFDWSFFFPDVDVFLHSDPEISVPLLNLVEEKETHM